MIGQTEGVTVEVEQFGAAASAYTKAALEGRQVELHTDRIGDTRDRYGRALRYVSLDGEDFNASLIRRGLTHAIRGFRYSKRAQFIRLEDEARRRGRGL